MSTPEAQNRRLFRRILWGLFAGVLAGLFFGEAIEPLSFVATGFIRLLQVNVLPYLLGSLIAGLGSRGTPEMKLLARYGVGLLLLVWGLTLVLVLLCPMALPPFSGAAIFSISEAPPAFDWLDLYIPANLFHALSNNLIPAVVLFGILAGIAVGQMAGERKAVLLQAVEAFNEAMTRVSRMILRLTPIGLFAIAAVSAGEIRVDELLRIQLWVVFYAGGTLLLTLWMLPALVARFAGVPYARFLGAMRNAIVTAAAAGDSLVVLPLIAESAKELLAERGTQPVETDRAVSVAAPLLYNFPHAGKILTLAFLPFGAWFSGNALGPQDMALLATAGPLSLFGSINAAVPFLLDLLRLPSDLFQFFTVSGVVNSRFGSLAAATHLAALTVLVSAAILGRLRLPAVEIVRFTAVTAAIMAAFVIGNRALFTWALPATPAGMESLSRFVLRPPLAPPPGVPSGAAAAAPPVQGARLQEIRARGVLRVGYFADAVPWAFVNANGDVVGHDIEAAHRLARLLKLALELVRVERTAPSADLTAGRIDILMSGFTATVSRAERMELSDPYSTEHVGFLVRDFQRQRFRSIETLQDGAGLHIAVPPIEGAAEALGQYLPRATTRVATVLEEAFADPEVTAVLLPLERSYYWSRIHPEFAAVSPEGMSVGTVTVYAVPSGEIELRNLVDLWIETRRASGEAEEAYQYWIRGRAITEHGPRWSVLRNVLGWR